MEHISYPKIGQFRNVVKEINHYATFTGLDEEGNSIYNDSLIKPVLEFKGTVKLHGTNASICYNDKDGVWAQSRNNIITIENDNAGFAKFISERETEAINVLNWAISFYDIDTSKDTVCIYGEFAGKGIQKGVAISELEKSFYIFGLSVVNDKKEKEWLDFHYPGSLDNRILNINLFYSPTITIDLNEPELSQNKLIELTEAVEKQCPVAAEFGKEGIGEGIVWTAKYLRKTYRFKVKGENHSVTKVKKLASVNTEKLNSINEFVEYSVTKQRVDQAIENVFGSEDPDIKQTGEIIRWVANDIIAEESDTLKSNSLTWKEVAGRVAKEVKSKFFKTL
jgi:hypothetical protein